MSIIFDDIAYGRETIAFCGLHHTEPVDAFGDLGRGERAGNGLLNEDAGTEGDSGESKPGSQHRYSGNCAINYIFRIESSTSFGLIPRTPGPPNGSYPSDAAESASSIGISPAASDHHAP